MKQVLRRIKKRRLERYIFLVILLFPIVVGIIYHLELPQIVEIESGDLISYYATVFGIWGSFITYRHEVNARKKERKQETKPFIRVELEDIEIDGVFKLTIYNYSKTPQLLYNLYDEVVNKMLEKECSYKLMFDQTVEAMGEAKKRTEIDYNITMEEGIVDEDGYPKSIQLLCEDTDRNMWDCIFCKINNDGKVSYYLRDIRISEGN